MDSSKDEQFKARLLTSGNEACLELGIDAVNPTAPTRLVVFEQTPQELFRWISYRKTIEKHLFERPFEAFKGPESW